MRGREGGREGEGREGAGAGAGAWRGESERVRERETEGESRGGRERERERERGRGRKRCKSKSRSRGGVSKQTQPTRWTLSATARRCWRGKKWWCGRGGGRDSDQNRSSLGPLYVYWALA
jgi:hypothetical protein